MQVLFGKHIKENLPTESEVYELKICKTKSIRWDRVADHQLQALLYTSGELGQYHKLTDQAWRKEGGFTYQKPYDCQYLKFTSAFIVVWFYKPRKPKVFIKITIDDFLKMKKQAKRKSFTEEMALQYGTEILITKKHGKK